MAALTFGCHLPVWGPAATRETLLTFARRMEDLGYDTLWASDHVVLPWTIRSRYPYNPTGAFPLPPTEPFLEPLTVLALVAGVTARIRLGTSVLVLPHRHPLLAAKMFATLDHVAPGRVVLGVGVGWMREEITMLGAPFEQRGAWSDEAIRLMRACWAPDERTRFAGEFFRVDDVGCFPKPTARIPIWIGGDTPRALRRVVELGDGWHAAYPDPAAMRGGVERLREACRRGNRDIATVTISARVGLPARRSADALRAEIDELRELGVAHVMLESRVRDLGDLVEIYGRFAREVRPRV